MIRKLQVMSLDGCTSMAIKVDLEKNLSYEYLIMLDCKIGSIQPRTDFPKFEKPTPVHLIPSLPLSSDNQMGGYAAPPAGGAGSHAPPRYE